MNPLLQVFFEEAAERLADYEQALVCLEKSPQDVELLNRIFRDAHTLKSNSAMLGFHAISRFTHTLEDLLDRLRAGALAADRAVVNVLLGSADILHFLLRHARETTSMTAAENEQVEQAERSMKGLLDHQPAAQPGTEQPGIAAPALPPETVLAAAAAEPVAISAGDAEPFRRRASDWEEATSIRVPVERVDRLINLVGELVITQSIVTQLVTSFTGERFEDLKEAVGQMDRHARELHERMMSIRMLPLRPLFGRFPRMVRDLAAALGKQATLEISGEDTELDKAVIERISDPLTHLVRNALDHGLESAAERLAAGKPAAGRIAIVAYQQGGNICIEISDDGRGIDLHLVRCKALDQGLIAPEQELSEEESLSLVYRPGFSTAAQVTELSGRGVGLDVVKKNLGALGGSITIQSTLGQGTRFRIKLPLTVAIMDGQAVCVGDQTYLLPLVSIVESVRPVAGSVHTVAGAGEVVVVRGQSIPLVRLYHFFDVDAAVVDPARGIVVIVEHDGVPAAILVDDILGQQQVVIKSLETNYQHVNGIVGATILGDGRVALILDVPGLFDLARQRPRTVVGQLA